MSAFLAQFRDFNNQWTAVTGVSILLWACIYLAPRFGFIPAALFAYASLSTVWVWIFTQNRYMTLDPYNQTGLKWSSADSFGKLIILLLPLIQLSKDRPMMRFFGEFSCYLFVMLNSIWICASVLEGCSQYKNSCGGMIGNPSIGVSLMVCMLPIFIESWREQWKILSLAVLSVFASQSSIAIGLLAVYAMASFVPALLEKGLSKKTIAGIFGGLGVMSLGYGLLGKEFLNDSDRLHIWKFMMARWAAPWNIPFGTGLGTYHVFSINLQKYGQADLSNFLGTNFWWNTLHNEPLQFLFECGVTGAILFIATYLIALIRALKIDFRVALSIALFGAYMLVDPALHNPLPALFGAWLFTYCLRKQNQVEII